MPDLRAVLVTIPLDDANLDRLRTAVAPGELVITTRDNVAEIDRALPRVDAAFLDGDLDARFLDAPHLRWVHCHHAGVERSARPELFARGVRLTSAAGRSAASLAEHALYFMLALTYDAPTLLDAQRARQWRRREPDLRRPLAGSTLGIVGLGHIGCALAARAHALGMQVVAYRRRVAGLPPGVQTVYAAEAGDSLDALLEQSDFVVLATSLNDATFQLMNRERLARMKPGAFLINVSRGDLIDEPALIEALHSRRLAGAGVDSVSVEPLPESSPLWNAPGLLITPHQTPRLPDREARALEILLDNIGRYRRDEPLRNELTAEDAFSQGVVWPADGWLRRLRRRVRRLVT